MNISDYIYDIKRYFDNCLYHGFIGGIYDTEGMNSVLDMYDMSFEQNGENNFNVFKSGILIGTLNISDINHIYITSCEDGYMTELHDVLENVSRWKIEG